MKNNNLEERLKKPKYIEIAIIGGIFSIITAFAFYLFPPDDTEFTKKIIICLVIITLVLFIVLIIEIINFNKFYNDYKEQYDYFINKNDKNNKDNKDIKKIKKDIKKLKDNSLEYDIIDEW